jgi:hypothetical protein
LLEIVWILDQHYLLLDAKVECVIGEPTQGCVETRDRVKGYESVKLGQYHPYSFIWIQFNQS